MPSEKLKQKALNVLKNVFGYNKYRDGQEEIINNISSNFIYSDVLEETSLSEDFMEELLEKLETAHSELVKAFH